MYMHEKVVDFCKTFSVDEPKFVKDIADPGAKSVESIESKARRNIAIYDNKEYSLKEINDMIRCTIMVDSYSQVPQLLNNLKKQIPSLTGYASECENGYRGIHLNFQIDGFNAEIQIHTPEVSFTNQACEAIYQRWRSFDEKVELEKIGKITDLDEQQRQMDKILQNARDAKNQYAACRELFNAQNQLTDFDQYKDIISGILTAYTYEYGDGRKELPQYLNKKLSVSIYKNGSIDEKKTRRQAAYLNRQAQSRQIKLIGIARACRDQLGRDNGNIKLRTIERFFKEASVKWDNILYKQIKEKTGSKSRFDYLVNPKKFTCLKTMYEFALAYEMDISNTSEIMKEFYASVPDGKKNTGENKKFSDISYYDMNGIIDFICDKIQLDKREEKEIVISR